MAAGLYPANGASGLSKSTQIRMDFCSMTGLQLNYFNLLNPDGSIFTDIVLDSGASWATLTPNTYLADGVTYTVEADGRIDDGGTIKAIAPGTWSFTVANPSTQYLYEEDFGGTGYSIPHVLTQNECTSQFGWGYATNANSGNLTLVADPSGGGRGPVLKIDFYEGNWGLNKTNSGFTPRNTGFQGSIWSHAGKDELYFAYDMFVPNSFIYNFSMKNTRMQGGLFQSNNDHVTNGGKYCECGMGWWGENPSSTAIRQTYGCGSQTNVDGDLSVYKYHVDDFQDNDNSGVPYDKGLWTTIEMHVKINTVSVADGEYHVWKNGVPIQSRTNVQWRNSVDPTMQWDLVSMVFYEGGGPCSAAPANQSLYIDNLIISDNRIT